MPYFVSPQVCHVNKGPPGESPVGMRRLLPIGVNVTAIPKELVINLPQNLPRALVNPQGGERATGVIGYV